MDKFEAGKAARTVAMVGGKALLVTLRYSAYALLTVVKPLVHLASIAAAGVGMFLFLALWVMHCAPDVMWGAAAAVVAASIGRLGFDALLQALAPPGTVIIS